MKRFIKKNLFVIALSIPLCLTIVSCKFFNSDNNEEEKGITTGSPVHNKQDIQLHNEHEDEVNKPERSSRSLPQISVGEAMKEVKSWMDIDGVEGISRTKIEGVEYLMVYVSKPPEKMKDEIPDNYKGIPVLLKKTGKIISQ